MTNKKRIPSITEAIDLPEATDAQISPDGKLIAYVVNRPDWDKDNFVGQIWLADASVKQPRQLTFAIEGSDTPRWSPSGDSLAFLSQRRGDQATQIYRIALSGGEAERLTEHEKGIRDLAWSPDGKTIAYKAASRETKSEEERRKRYGNYRVENEDYRPEQLWQLDIASRETRQLTSGKGMHVQQFTWSPAGDVLAFAAAPSPDAGDWDRGRIYHLDSQTLHVTALTGEGCENPCWSPAGDVIAYTRAGEPSHYTNNQLESVPASGGEATPLLPEFDEKIMQLTWTASGMYFVALHQSEGSRLYRWNPDSCELSCLTPDNWFGIEFSISRETGRVAQVANDATHYYELCFWEPEARKWTRLTDFTSELAEWRMPTREIYRWQSGDGVEIEGILTRPADFDPHKKYPLLVIIHGGPTWASHHVLLSDESRYLYPTLQWAARGAVILQPNYRGSSGFGKDFRALNVRNLGIGDAEDVLSGVDALLREGWIDEDRLGAMGWSQGGYISAFLTTTCDRFQAVSVGAGISNWVTYYVNTDIHPFTRQYLKATPWDEMEIYARTSPMTYINQATTPTLIQHGERDRRVPVPNAYELYQGLQDMGVESRLVVYRGMGHGPGDSPRFCRHIMEDNEAWFGRWIWGDSQEVEPAQCYVAAPEVNWREVRDEALRDGADFRLLSSESGLLTTEDAPEKLPVIDAVRAAEAAKIIGGQLAEQQWQEITLYTLPLKSNPASRVALGCMQIASGLVEECVVVHNELE